MDEIVVQFYFATHQNFVWSEKSLIIGFSFLHYTIAFFNANCEVSSFISLGIYYRIGIGFRLSSIFSPHTIRLKLLTCSGCKMLVWDFLHAHAKSTHKPSFMETISLGAIWLNYLHLEPTSCFEFEQITTKSLDFMENVL